MPYGHLVPRLCSACATQSFDSHSLAQDDTGWACSVGARLWLTPHTKIDAQADIFTFIPLEKA
ncbi:MAG: hypothetical protein IJY24_05940 [Clostridia bacterium]|nr:hypothetical protein [Clostridia bacterium]